MKILLVEDNDAVRLTTSVLLEEAGHQVAEASSIGEARRQLEGAPFDLVLTDLHLGDGLGTDLLPDIRRFAPRARVAVLSGSMTAEIGDGADLVLEKPVAPEELVRRIEALRPE